MTLKEPEYQLMRSRGVEVQLYLYIDKKYKCVSFVVHYAAITKADHALLVWSNEKCLSLLYILIKLTKNNMFDITHFKRVSF